MQGFTIADNVSSLDKRRRPNAQARLEYGREVGYTRPLPKGPVKHPFSVLSVSSVAKYPSKPLFTCLLIYLSTQQNRSIILNAFVENKPNFMHFYAKNPDSSQKQTQTNPIQTQNKAIFTPKNQPQTKNKPNFKSGGFAVEYRNNLGCNITMQIIAKCPGCGNSCLLEADAADRRIKCRKCRTLFKVPKLEEVPKALKLIKHAKGKIYVDQDGKTFG